VTDDGQYLIIHVWRGTDPKNQVFYKPLAAPDAEVVELLSGLTLNTSSSATRARCSGFSPIRMHRCGE
jgi:hypothetical protein